MLTLCSLTKNLKRVYLDEISGYDFCVMWPLLNSQKGHKVLKTIAAMKTLPAWIKRDRDNTTQEARGPPNYSQQEAAKNTTAANAGHFFWKRMDDVEGRTKSWRVEQRTTENHFPDRRPKTWSGSWKHVPGWISELPRTRYSRASPVSSLLNISVCGTYQVCSTTICSVSGKQITCPFSSQTFRWRYDWLDGRHPLKAPRPRLDLMQVVTS